MSLEQFKKSLQKIPVIKKEDYSYVVHPLTDGIPEIKPELLREVTSEMKKHIKKCGPIDKIVTIEAMGIPLATALSLDMNIPFTIIRKREYGLSGEICVEQKTGYSKSKLYINGLQESENVVIVDDILSTGGTLRLVLSVLKDIGVDVKMVIVAIDKGNCAEEVDKEFDVQIMSLIKMDINDDEIRIT
jgi:adenine phosphoribosyltransferase